MWIFVNSLIENPTFDSQTKETMTLQSKSFGSKCEVSEKFIKEIHKGGIVESIMSWVRFKQSEQQDKKCSSKKTSKLKVNFLKFYLNFLGTSEIRRCKRRWHKKLTYVYFDINRRRFS